MMGAVSAAVLVSMALAIFRSIKGPTVYDRILSVNAFGTLTVVLISVYVFLSGRPEFLDLALVYALINFIGTIAVTKYVEFSHMGRPSGGDELGDI
jgi:multicomponent Na+:H+ antiporter subunit F